VLATGFQRAGLPALRSSHTSDQVLERATEPRYISAPDPFERREEVVEITEQMPEIVTDEEVAVAAAANAPVNNPAAQSEEGKNDLELPAFMRRERRLFQ
jgi:hypothetical protein